MVAPLVKVTSPVGSPIAPGPAVIVAVSVTCWPAVGALGATSRTVIVASRPRSTVIDVRLAVDAGEAVGDRGEGAAVGAGR